MYQELDRFGRKVAILRPRELAAGVSLSKKGEISHTVARHPFDLIRGKVVLEELGT